MFGEELKLDFTKGRLYYFSDLSNIVESLLGSFAASDPNVNSAYIDVP